MSHNVVKHKYGTVMRIFLLVALSLFLMLDYGNNHINTSHYIIYDKTIPNVYSGFKIALISDLHNKSFGKGNARLLHTIKSAVPDIIVICGDVCNANMTDLTHVNEFFHALDTLNIPTYFIFGNHEALLSPNVKTELNSILSSTNITVLNNKSSDILIDGKCITLYGLTQPTYFYSGVNDYGEPLYPYTSNDIDLELGKADKNTFNILLTHNPLYFEAYANWGANLTLCGHIHGGLIRIPFLGGVLSPNMELFPKYCAGEYSLNTQKLIVSRGLSESILVPRIFNTPEICIITLEQDNT